MLRSTTALGHPDPMRAHGAWIYLFASIGAGAVVGANQRVEPALLVATAFVGTFLVVAAISTGTRRKERQLLLGASLAVLAPIGALWMNADSRFFAIAGIAALPACAANILAKRRGFLSPATLLTGVAALGMAAPTTAVAGGTSLLRGAVLFALLWAFFCWRTLQVAAMLGGTKRWDKEMLRARGIREAAITAVWSLVVAVSLRLF